MTDTNPDRSNLASSFNVVAECRRLQRRNTQLTARLAERAVGDKTFERINAELSVNESGINLLYEVLRHGCRLVALAAHQDSTQPRLAAVKSSANSSSSNDDDDDAHSVCDGDAHLASPDRTACAADTAAKRRRRRRRGRPATIMSPAPEPIDTEHLNSYSPQSTASSHETSRHMCYNAPMSPLPLLPMTILNSPAPPPICELPLAMTASGHQHFDVQPPGGRRMSAPVNLARLHAPAPATFAGDASFSSVSYSPRLPDAAHSHVSGGRSLSSNGSISAATTMPHAQLFGTPSTHLRSPPQAAMHASYTIDPYRSSPLQGEPPAASGDWTM